MNQKKQKPREILVKIRRYVPDDSAEPFWQNFALYVKTGMTVLDGLHEIKANFDQSLCMRFSCRMGVCGSCAMLINGRPSLACNTQILEVASTVLTLAPLPNFAVIKDLVPDLTPLFEKHVSIMPFMQSLSQDKTNNSNFEYYQSIKELTNYLQFAYCIKCGACMAACPTVATDREYLGPMPLTQAHRYNSDTRDNGFDQRKKIVGTDSGAFRCHYAGECSNVCPKGVDPAKAIQYLKRTLVLDYLKLLKKKAPCREMKKGEKKFNPDIPKVPEYTVQP